MNWSRKQAGWSKNLKMRGTPPMEQEQETSQLEQKLENEGNSPNGTRVGNKSVGAKT